eukprot:CAMPEP_0198115006 /NCGR_PEP_ID=MMETSP1442-20131203/6228_1 /TAXON_ID= /ORGANISM="Craspedostauros australis, Strain CCMP3328" /LENGTH=126 /DNA_ID=CAMNT_0043772425 /DNA_START=313 /DNA_END=693 /DNA_ORIENTATION=-
MRCQQYVDVVECHHLLFERQRFEVEHGRCVRQAQFSLQNTGYILRAQHGSPASAIDDRDTWDLHSFALMRSIRRGFDPTGPVVVSVQPEHTQRTAPQTGHVVGACCLELPVFLGDGNDQPLLVRRV